MKPDFYLKELQTAHQKFKCRTKVSHALTGSRRYDLWRPTVATRTAAAVNGTHRNTNGINHNQRPPESSTQHFRFSKQLDRSTPTDGHFALLLRASGSGQRLSV
jgi:hypothetical protein